MPKRILPIIILFVAFNCFFNNAFAQPSWTIDLLNREKKPEKFKERKLGSEKMASKKFTVPRHFFQNNYTHYNYYFNANNKINAVVERAKLGQKDDYSKLFPFYPYTLESTSSQKTELDSVILKATAGILLHDLRNDWVDNMYLLIGKAYFFRKDLDSAIATFQFINYNLFPRKRKNDDDNRVIGTTDAAKNSAISIANKEKQNILQKIASQPPSRNDALIWLARTLIEQGEYSEAGGLISTLQKDPNLPKRLQNDLNEVNAYWFYKQEIYDSAAVYLEQALSVAGTKDDQSHWEFLLAQLYEMTNQFDKASTYYDKAATHTTSPLMDIHAQLNNAKMMKASNPVELDKSIANLVHMAKKDKFESYRDILYYSAGELALQKPDTNAAVIFYNKTLQYNETNISYKNKAFIQLGDIAYSRKQYKLAFADYDSLQSDDSTIADKLEKIQLRRNGLSKIVEKIDIIEREDSLQRIAAMAPAERDVFIKKLVKRLRKEKGLKEDEFNDAGGTVISFDNNKDQPADLFANNNKGEWYFYNPSLKSKGYREFKSKWGKRTNSDNWRKKVSTENQIISPAFPDNSPNANPDDIDAAPVFDEIKDKNKMKKPGTEKKETGLQDISYVGLMEQLPLTEDKMKASNELLAQNLFELAKLYQSELEDYEQAIITYNQSLQRFPDSLYNGEIYLGLYYCYTKLGNTAKAAYYKDLLTSKFSGSHASKVLTDPAAANPTAKNPQATKRYEDIYNLFIEGKFDEALTAKKNADSAYGNNYWSPQLLYIEAVYQVKQRNDSAAKNILDTIIQLYPSSPLKQKAQRLADVVSRRKEIESYLTNLQVTRAAEDSITRYDSTGTIIPPVIQPAPTVTTDTNRIKTAPLIITPAAKDSVKKAAPAIPVISGGFTFSATAPHQVVMLLDKVDGTYINEAKNAFARYNNDRFRMDDIKIAKEYLDADRVLLVFSSFTDAEAAIQYLAKIRKAAPDEISWLPANKYSFFIITAENLQLLKNNKDLDGYKKALSAQFPGRL